MVNLLGSEDVSNVMIEVTALGVGSEQCAIYLGRDIEVVVNSPVVKPEFEEVMVGQKGSPGQGRRFQGHAVGSHIL